METSCERSEKYRSGGTRIRAFPKICGYYAVTIVPRTCPMPIVVL